MDSDTTVNFEEQFVVRDEPIDISGIADASRVINWHEPQRADLQPELPNRLNELTASNDSHTRAKFVGQISHPLIMRQKSLKLSQSAPNLELFDRQAPQLTHEEYTAQFINENLRLFEFYHNLTSNAQLDQSLHDYSNEEAGLFQRENETGQLNENAIDFLKNFSSHQYLHQYRQATNETNGSSMAEQPQSGPMVDYSAELTQNHLSEEDYIKIDLNDRSKVGFLYKNGQDKRELTESTDLTANNVVHSNLDFNSKIRKNSKVIFSNNEPDEEEEQQEIACPPVIPTDYSVATILEQNNFAVSDVFELARELKRTYLFKILIMGDSNTGKTSFVKRFTCNSTPRHYMPTIGLEFSMKIIDLKDEQKEVKLQLWDISAERNQNSLSKLYFRDAVGAMVFFDCSREASFKNVDKWKEQLDANVRLTDGSKLPTILIGNKCDLKKDGLCKDQALIQESCRQFEFNEYFLVSAKTNRNVKESIMCLIKLIFDSRMEFTYNAGLIKLDESDEEPRSGFRCFC